MGYKQTLENRYADIKAPQLLWRRIQMVAKIFDQLKVFQILWGQNKLVDQQANQGVKLEEGGFKIGGLITHHPIP